MAKKELTYRCFVLINDEKKSMEDLSDTDKKAVIRKMSKNLSKAMSEYYACHPEKAVNL